VLLTLDLREVGRSRSLGRKKLTTGQLVALSSLFVEQKEKGEKDRDFSLLQLLETFKGIVCCFVAVLGVRVYLCTLAVVDSSLRFLVSQGQNREANQHSLMSRCCVFV
jgi:hypothetical protein